MSDCRVDGCGKAAQYGGLCLIHAKREEWLDNLDINNLGIVKFSHDLFPHRIDKKYGVPNIHKEIYADLLDAMINGTDKYSRLHAIAAPREHSKSTIVCYVFVLYCILFELKRYIVIISESHEKTIQFIRAIKKALALPAVMEYFGNISAVNMVSEGGKWTEGHIVTSTGIHIRALGMGKSTRGLVEDTRPDLIIADDIESENNTKTEEVREGNWSWWRKAVVPAADIIKGQCVYIGTMVHYGCILARLMEQGNRYRKHLYQVFTDDTWTQTIWPQKFTMRIVREIMEDYRSDPERGIDQFYSEYLNIAVAPESRKFPDSSIIKKEFHFHGLKQGNFIECDGQFLNCNLFLGVDPAHSKKKGSANTAIVLMAEDWQGGIWVIDYIRKKIPIRKAPSSNELGQIEYIIQYLADYKIERIGYEVTGMGSPMVHDLRIEIENEMIRRRTAGLRPISDPQVIDLQATGDMTKEERIGARLEGVFRQGKVTIRPNMPELVQELSQFPKSRYKDLVDALANAKEISYPPSRIAYRLEGEYQPLKKSKRVVRDWEVTF
jgi:hypothetical protein